MFGFLAVLVFLATLFFYVKGCLSTKGGDVGFSVAGLKKGTPILVIGIVVSYILGSVVIIQPGDAGAIFNIFTGVTDRNLMSGAHIVPAVINRVEVYDIYTKTYTESINCLSSDGLPVAMDVSIRFKLFSNVSAILKSVGTEKDVEEKILIPTCRSKMRDVAAEFTAKQAYADKRMELQARYDALLMEYFKGESYIDCQQILIRQVTPPADLIAKVQETKVSEQEVVNQQNVLTAARIKKEQVIVTAQAEAEALRIKGGSITNNPKIIQLEWVNKWDGKLPVTMMGDAKGIMVNLGNVGN